MFPTKKRSQSNLTSEPAVILTQEQLFNVKIFNMVIGLGWGMFFGLLISIYLFHYGLIG